LGQQLNVKDTPHLLHPAPFLGISSVYIKLYWLLKQCEQIVFLTVGCCLPVGIN